MVQAPQTRASLLLRIRNRDDGDAWEEFLEIYQPVLYRMARSRGYQDADAREIVQEVLLAISKEIESFRPRKEVGSFRAWLSTMVRHKAINQFVRKKQVQGIGGSCFAQLALDQIDPQSSIESDLEAEHRKQLFYWGAEKVQKQVNEATWQAFWRTAVLEESSESVAKSLGLTTGAVYVAKSRVIARLRECIEIHQSQQQPKG